NQLEKISTPQKNIQHNYAIASLQAFLEVGKSLIFSEPRISEYQQQLMDSLQRALPEKVFQASIDFGNQVAQDIIAYANADNYNQTRGFRYTIMEEPGKWQPTPPAYMDAIEPNWNKIRPFVLDSANQFVPPPPTPFSLEKGSRFYNELMEVYETGKNLTDEQKEIASFWDCNPYVMHTMGHAMYATKKITPGGHWMGIVQVANKQAEAKLMQSVQAYMLVSITLADAFISCWDEKYRSNLIRPETVIDAHVDDTWDPLLQTPPFPEYTSGHSVISEAAATMLTHLYGNSFAFADSVEVKYGLPVREFDSFHHAAEEAAISRLYGGIHYRPAISNGLAQGAQVGKYLVEKLAGSDQVAMKE
ncbi:MAG: vanadium-dependent haloperoxidase, partial [Cyclobacteriaceae bacterium]